MPRERGSGGVSVTLSPVTAVTSLLHTSLNQLGDEVLRNFEEHADAWWDLLENVRPGPSLPNAPIPTP